MTKSINAKPLLLRTTTKYLGSKLSIFGTNIKLSYEKAYCIEGRRWIEPLNKIILSRSQPFPEKS